MQRSNGFGFSVWRSVRTTASFPVIKSTKCLCPDVPVSPPVRAMLKFDDGWMSIDFQLTDDDGTLETIDKEKRDGASCIWRLAVAAPIAAHYSGNNATNLIQPSHVENMNWQVTSNKRNIASCVPASVDLLLWHAWTEPGRGLCKHVCKNIFKHRHRSSNTIAQTLKRSQKT